MTKRFLIAATIISGILSVNAQATKEGNISPLIEEPSDVCLVLK